MFQIILQENGIIEWKIWETKNGRIWLPLNNIAHNIKIEPTSSLHSWMVKMEQPFHWILCEVLKFSKSFIKTKGISSTSVTRKSPFNTFQLKPTWYGFSYFDIVAGRVRVGTQKECWAQKWGKPTFEYYCQDWSYNFLLLLTPISLIFVNI